MQSYFPTGQLFFHPPETLTSQKYTVMYKMTTSSQQSLFCDSQMKKTCLKQQLQNFIQQRNAKKT